MKTFVYIGTSIDGFIAGENGDLDWLEKFAIPEVFDVYSAFIKKIDAIVIGRGTFEKVLAFPAWPYKRKVFLLSSSIKELPAAIKDKVTILSTKPAAVLELLSKQGFTGVNINGGNVIQSFLKEDLIDELIVSKVPVLIGSGIPLFGELNTDLAFSHIETMAYSNGLVMSRYERKRGHSATGAQYGLKYV